MGIKDVLLNRLAKNKLSIPAKLTEKQEIEYAEDIGIGKYYEERDKEREYNHARQLRFDKSVKRAVQNNQINNVNYDYEQRHKKELQNIEKLNNEKLDKLMTHIKIMEKQITKLTIENDILAGRVKKAEEKEKDNTVEQLNSTIEQLASEIFDK